MNQRAASARQLSLWPSVWSEAARCAPNLLLRAALFAALGDAPRRFLDRVELATNADSRLTYTGVQLDQGDLDVWLNLLHIARLQPMGNQVRCTAYKLLQVLGRADTGANRQILHKRILRLKATAIELQSGPITYIGSLIQSACKDEVSREYVIVIDPALHPLFARHQFTYLDKAIRQGLSGKPLAQWVHAFYSTHGAPYPLTAAYLHQLSGSANADPKSFRQKLRRALLDVESVSRRHGCAFRATWRGDAVHVVTDEPVSDAEILSGLGGVDGLAGVPSDGIPQLIHSTVAEDTVYRWTGYQIPSDGIPCPQAKSAAKPHDCLIDTIGNAPSNLL